MARAVSFTTAQSLCRSEFSFFTPRWLQVIRKNRFNPIGFVKAGLFPAKIVHFTICPIFEGIFKIIPEKPQIRPVKKDEKGESKPALNPDGDRSMRVVKRWFYSFFHPPRKGYLVISNFATQLLHNPAGLFFLSCRHGNNNIKRLENKAAV